MSFNEISEDLRSVRTEKALYAAMFTLLKTLNFRKITIKGICEEALISRAAFYSHYIDKYDLLRHWMRELWQNHFNDNHTFEQIEKVINCHIHENVLLFRNLIYDADQETIAVLFDFILSTINVPIEKDGSEDYPKNIVLSNFFAGGMISYLTWQVKNKFPSEVPLMNRHLYEMIHELQNWTSK